MSDSPPREATGTIVEDSRVAAKSAAMLGGSLLATWSVALLVRLYLPRHLGPELMGVLTFADGFTTAFFIVLAMGVDLYIQKEIPVRPKHASDFFGGVLAARLIASIFLFAAMAAFMAVTNRPAAVQRVVLVYGLAQVFLTLNASLAALLHASREVSGLSVLNIVAKVLWGAGIIVALTLGFGLMGIAFALLGSEIARTVALIALTKRHVGLTFRVDLTAVKLVILASLPFYVNKIALTLYSRLDVTFLALLSNDAEVGWYGTAGNLANLALLLSPLTNWVLLPLLSRAASRSERDLFAILQPAIEVILLAVMPVALLMGIGADVWIPLLFGEAFAPATLTLRILSPIFVFTYLAMISASCLLLLGRAWTVAVISIAALALSPTLSLLLIPWGMGALGPGGAGVGAAIALLVTEVSVTVALTSTIGKRAFSPRSARSIGKAVIACGVTIAADLALRSLGPLRLAIDMALYIGLLFAIGAVKFGNVITLARFLLGKSISHART